MPSFKKFYKENRKKAIQSQKNSLKLLQLLMILCSYNFIKFSMCSYNFNVAVRISINLYARVPAKRFVKSTKIVYTYASLNNKFSSIAKEPNKEKRE